MALQTGIATTAKTAVKQPAAAKAVTPPPPRLSREEREAQARLQRSKEIAPVIADFKARQEKARGNQEEWAALAREWAAQPFDVRYQATLEHMSPTQREFWGQREPYRETGGKIAYRATPITQRMAGEPIRLYEASDWGLDKPFTPTGGSVTVGQAAAQRAAASSSAPTGTQGAPATQTAPATTSQPAPATAPAPAPAATTAGTQAGSTGGGFLDRATAAETPGEVEARAARIAGGDSPLMRQAGYYGQAQAANRGLLHSSLAAGAAQAAVLDRATDIASQDTAAALSRDRLGLDTELGRGRLDLDRSRHDLDAELGRGRLSLDTELGRGGLAETIRSNQAREAIDAQNAASLDRAREAASALGISQLQAQIQQAATDDERAALQLQLEAALSAQNAKQSIRELAAREREALLNQEHLSAEDLQKALQAVNAKEAADLAVLDRQFAADQFSGGPGTYQGGAGTAQTGTGGTGTQTQAPVPQTGTGTGARADTGTQSQTGTQTPAGGGETTQRSPAYNAGVTLYNLYRQQGYSPGEASDRVKESVTGRGGELQKVVQEVTSQTQDYLRQSGQTGDGSGR